ncbi:MAG: DNA polymerase III subunit alpha [Candidatus Kerfeldbacteria bacterium]|nr:DNA polymerase III subunit alpha [Candidatus Kerfeldbacteria bacterium]
MAFTHLHVHSHYSLLDGLPKIDALVQQAHQLGMTSLALTDHGSLYGAIEFYQACRRRQLKPIIGTELYVAQRSRFDKQPRLDDRPYHLVVLAETTEGYYNLLRLISQAHLEGFYYKPRVDFDLLQQYHTGLIALSACLNGQVARTILQHDVAHAKTVVQQYQTIFGANNFFLEVQQHPSLPEQEIVNTALRALSADTTASLVATADSHYLTPNDAEAQDILVCIQTKKLLSDTKRLSMRQENYSLASADEMAERFRAWPEAYAMTETIAARCSIDISLGQIHIPHYALPSGQTADQALANLCQIGLQQRYAAAITTTIQDRLAYELDIIHKTGYASYFLIVQDFVNWAKQNHIVVGPGRGSAAGSIVAYLTGITAIDPIKYDLLFERFLNPERVSMPDIDLDFADTRRAEVLNYVESKYGSDHVAQIITFGTMAARAAVRDVGRVLGLNYGFCDMVAKLIPLFTSLEQALKQVPELQTLYQSDPDALRLLDGAIKLEGVARHTSTHACGVVITKEPLDHYTPIQYSSSDNHDVVTQYSLHAIEDLGLLKMDFLGLKNLTIIEQTIELIEKTTGEQIVINDVPLDDKATYRLLQRGQTTGIFQLESQGMKRCLRDLKPTEFEDIIAMVALYRPGPMERIPEYIDSKHGRRQTYYLHPLLKPILQKTYGILVYQEQVMALVRDLAGFTAGEGYLLIKAVAKKISSLLNEQKNKFISGCQRNGIDQRIADQLWEFIEPFARYGFNKSHSTGYALIAYQTAYLKAHYPAQFMASLLTSDQSDSDRIAIEVQEAREVAIAVLPPDVNESFSTFTVVKESLPGTPRIRFGLAAIKNVGQNVINCIITERKTNGPYQSIENFLNRIHHKDLNRKSLESLIKSSAMDVVGDTATLLNNLDRLLEYNRSAQQERLTGQANLFSHLPQHSIPKLRLVATPPLPQAQRLAWEKDLLGLYVSAHPLEQVFNKLPPGIIALQPAMQARHNSDIKALGLVNQLKRITTKKGEAMMFLQLEDPTAACEVIIFPSSINKVKTVLHDGDSIVVTGKLTKRNGETKIIADQVEAFKLLQ